MNHCNGHPPFRAEHVGSFPRPDRLLKARQDYFAGRISKEDLKRMEADCIIQSNWNVSYMKNQQDNWNVSYMKSVKDFQDNWSTSYMK